MFFVDQSAVNERRCHLTLMHMYPRTRMINKEINCMQSDNVIIWSDWLEIECTKTILLQKF
jgi:hypothetical protein